MRLLVMMLLALPVPAHALDIEWSEEVTVAPTMGYMKNNGTKDGGPQVGAGMFVGTLMEKRVAEKKQLGVLGFALVGGTPVGEGLDMAYSVAGCPLTFFEDRIQPCYGYNFTDGTGMLYVGASVAF